MELPDDDVGLEVRPALAAGNTVVLKPSDTTPASSYWMVEKMQDIFPRGVCNLVCGDRETGAALTAHPIPQLVSITGSTQAGIAVATAAAKDVKRAHLELGGKAPVLVFDDADIESTVEGIRPLATSTPARTAPRRPGSSPKVASTRSSWPPWPRR